MGGWVGGWVLQRRPVRCDLNKRTTACRDTGGQVSRWVISLLLVEGAFTPIMFGGVVVVGLSYAAVAFRGPKGQAQILGGFIILSSIVLGITGVRIWLPLGLRVTTQVGTSL